MPVRGFLATTAVAIAVAVTAPVPATAQAPTPVPSSGSGWPLPPWSPTAPPSQPSPTARPAADPASVPEPPAADKPGFFDIGGRIREALTSWWRDLVGGAIKPAADLVGQMVLRSPDLPEMPRVREMWWLSVGIANSVFVLLILLGGMLVMGHESVQTSYTIKDVAPRLVVAFIAANTSMVLAGFAIDAANGLSSAFLGQDLDAGLVGTSIARITLAAMTSNLFAIFLGLVVVILALVLVVVGLLRLCTLLVLVAAAPICLAGHALPTTEGLARLWWRALIAVLGVQVAQSLVLAVMLRVFLEAAGRPALGVPGGPLMDLLVVICMLWLLIRIPSWAGRTVVARGSNSAVRAVKYLVVQRAVRGVVTGGL